MIQNYAYKRHKKIWSIWSWQIKKATISDASSKIKWSRTIVFGHCANTIRARFLRKTIASIIFFRGKMESKAIWFKEEKVLCKYMKCQFLNCLWSIEWEWGRYQWEDDYRMYSRTSFLYQKNIPTDHWKNYFIHCHRHHFRMWNYALCNDFFWLLTITSL